MNFRKTRWIAFLLIFAFCVSLMVVPALAVAEEIEDTAAASAQEEDGESIDPSSITAYVVPEAEDALPSEETTPSDETQTPDLPQDEQPADAPTDEPGEEAPLEEDAASVEPDGDEDENETYTVTYYLGKIVYCQQTVEAGSTPYDIPSISLNGKENTGWLNDSGSFVVVTETKIEKDTSFYAWFAPTLVTEHIRYINGTGDAKFGPEDELTRAQAATLLYNLLETKEKGDYECSFSDVKSTSWYYEAVTTLASYKVLTGYTDGTFRPNMSMTRAEFVTMLVRMVGVQSGSVSFSDTVPNWAKNYVATAVNKGWINGYAEDNSFRANDSITRAQAVKIINRMLGRTPDESTINTGSDILTYLDVTNKNAWYYYEVEEASVGHTYNAASSGETWTNYNVESCGLSQGIHTIDGVMYYVSADTQQIASLIKGVNELDGGLYLALQAGKTVYADLSANPGYATYAGGTTQELSADTFNLLGGSSGVYVYCDAVDGVAQVHKLSAGVNQLKGAYYLANDDLYTICREFTSVSVNSSGIGVVEAKGKLYITDGYLTIRTKGEAYSDATSKPTVRDLRGCTYEFNSNMYYVQSDYSLARNVWVGYLYFDSKGRYTTGDSTLDAYVYNALQYGTSPEGNRIPVLNNNELPQRSKLMYAYYYMRGGYDKTYKTSPFRYWNTGLGVMRARYNDQTQYSWTISCAKYMFENSRGMCYEWAAAYLYMARRLGFQSYLVVGNVFSDRSATDAARHCWAMIKWDGKWHISDVELEWGYISSYYTQTSTYWNLFEQTLAMEYLSYYENPECSTIKYIFKDESDMYS